MNRYAVAFVLLGLVAAGLAYDRVVDMPPSRLTVESDQLVVSPSMADPPRLDGAWYCPVGSSTAGGYADHVINITNLADEPAVANLGIVTDAGPGPRRRIELAPRSTQRVQLSEIQVSAVAGAVVEITGGRGAVGHSVMTAQGLAEGPCATHASSTWYFAAGRTTLDSQEYLVLMNPFPETAVFDVQFQAVGRSREPGPLQGAFVEARSVRIIDVNRFVTREESLAAKITTARGRLVVERLQLLDGQLGPAGAALQLGVPTPARSWMFTAGRVQEGGDDLLTVYNPYEPDLTAPPIASTTTAAPADERTDTTDTTDATAGSDDPTSTTGEAGGDGLGGATVLEEEEGTTTVAVELWPTNPTDLSTYSVVTIEREVRPGTFVTIDLRAQAERFEFPLPYELGVNVTSLEGLPIVAERWQFADRLVLDTLAAVAGADDGGTEGDAAAGEEGDGTAVEGEAAADGEAMAEGGDEATADALPELQAPEEVTGLPQPIATQGVSTTRGNELFSTRWVIPWITITGDSTLVAVAALEEASVEVHVLSGGRWEGPYRATVIAGGRAIIPVATSEGGAAIEVVADSPISVEATVVVPDVSLDLVPGVPTVAN